MTAFIARLPDGLRHVLWLMYFFPGVYLELWWKHRDSPRFDNLVTLCWDLGWRGIKDVK